MVSYQDLQSEQNLIDNQALHIDGLDNHLLCPVQFCLNGVHISEVPKFLAKSPTETTHAIEFVNPFNAAHTLIIIFQLGGVTIYVDVYSPSIAE